MKFTMWMNMCDVHSIQMISIRYINMREFAVRNKRTVTLGAFIFLIPVFLMARTMIYDPHKSYIPLAIYEMSDDSTVSVETPKFTPLTASEETQIVESILRKIVPPVSRSTPYNLTESERKYFSQYGQDEVIEKIFGSKRNGFFIEAGGHTGEQFSNSLYFERNLGWSGLMVEPLKPSFKKLLEKKRKTYNLQACLSTSNRQEKITLSYPENETPAIASMMATDNSIPLVKEQIDCYPLGMILKALHKPVVDFFSLDIEGIELKVLQSIPWDDVKFKVITVEVNHLPEGKKNLRRYMEEKGYIFHQRVVIDYIFYHQMFANELNLSGY